MNFKIGGVYQIVFYDHCVGGSDPIECEVFGRVLKQTDKFVSLSWWNVINGDEATTENNREMVNLIKSTILTKKKVL